MHHYQETFIDEVRFNDALESKIDGFQELYVNVV